VAYIGAVAPGYDPTRASVPQLDAERFSGNSSTTAFTLTRKVVSPTDIEVIVENVQQEPTTAYTVDGYTLNFTEAPSTGTNNIYVIYRNSGTSNYAYVPDGSITYAKLANNIRQFTVDTFTANGSGSTVVLSETPASANTLVVTVDGVVQSAPTNYTLSGTTLTFTSVPDNGANIVVKHLGFRTTATVQALQAGSVTTTELADGSVTNPKIVSVANTKITGNIISSQIAPSVTLTTPLISGNLSLDSTGATGFRVPSANTLVFYEGGIEAARIDSNGNLGVGISNPAFRFAVQDGSGATRANIINTANAGSGAGIYLEVYNGVTQNSAVTLRADNADNFAIINKNGSQFVVDSSGLVQFNSGYGSVATAYGCRAWVNFNGTGTPAIRASGNVSSITDNGDGDYTVNFTNAMPDINYAALLSGSREPSTGGGVFCQNIFTNNTTGGNVAPTTTAARFSVNRGSGLGGSDVSYICVAIFR
jgi:hypothetical protein